MIDGPPTLAPNLPVGRGGWNDPLPTRKAPAGEPLTRQQPESIMQSMKKPSPSAVKFVGCKELRRLQQQACAAGWTPYRKKSGVMWRSPNGMAAVMLHESASDSRAIKNATANFRAGGLVL